jgi:hypothetical protein
MEERVRLGRLPASAPGDHYRIISPEGCCAGRITVKTGRQASSKVLQEAQQSIGRQAAGRAPVKNGLTDCQASWQALLAGGGCGGGGAAQAGGAGELPAELLGQLPAPQYRQQELYLGRLPTRIGAPPAPTVALRRWHAFQCWHRKMRQRARATYSPLRQGGVARQASPSRSARFFIVLPTCADIN